MCGICGIYSYEKRSPVNKQLISKMCSVMQHRGPDDTGYLDRSFLQLGHVRLSIIDLDSGKQPLSNETGRVNVVFNGEIYNYKDIRESLEQKGHIFKTMSDTEVLVHGYEEYGKGITDKLIGDFAFCIWDDNRQYFLLVRDRLGVKPLYYANVNGKFIFASEITSIIAIPWVPRNIDNSVIKTY